jgi:hypothetical protein
MSEAVAHGAKARLELARDILKIRESLTPDASIGRKHLAANRIGAIRRVLLGREGGGLIDEFLSPAIGGKKLQKIIDEAGALPTLERVPAITYAYALASGLSALASAEAKHGLWSDRGSFSNGKVHFGPHDGDELVDAQIERGRLPSGIREKLPELLAMASLASSASVENLLKEHAPEVYAAREADGAECARLSKAFDAAGEEIRAIMKEISAGAGGAGVAGSDALADRLEAARESYKVAQQAYKDHFDSPGVKKTNEAAHKAIKAGQAKLQAPLIEAAKAFTESVVQASPVSAEQATAWAHAQDITPQARARLKKIGYDLKQVRQDMAEFYRLSGGRVVKVKIHSKGDRRANTTGIEDHGKEGTINLDSAFDKRVLWHELAHHIEADPVAKMAAGKFIRRRSVDGKAYSLNSLIGGKGYRSNESAFKDHFFNPYVGKIYNHGTTEVFSMGVESFSDLLTLGQRMAQDPETLEFVAGYLKQPIHPLAKAHMALRERLIDVTSEANEEASSEASKGLEQLQAKIAQGVEYEEDTDTQWLVDSGWSWQVRGKVVGRFPGTSWWLLEDKVRNPDTKRMAAGYMLARVEKTDRLNSRGEPSWSLQRREYVPRDLNLVKVAVACERKTGQSPWHWEINDVTYLRKIAEA